MDRADGLLDTLDALELRVLSGPQQGARAPIAAGAGFVLAADAGYRGAGADIMLREHGTAPARLRVTAELGHALIEVLDGEVTLGEQVLAAGAQAAWPRHAVLAIGGATVAFGLACEDEWQPGGTGLPAPVPAAPVALPLRRRAEVWLAATGAGILLACAGTLWMARVAAAPGPLAEVESAPSMQALAGALAEGGFATLDARQRDDGRVEVRGRLPTLAQRARLDAWLAAQQVTAALDVVVDEAVARDVTEVFRVNGVAVQARTAGAGHIVAEASESDAARLAKAEDVVRRDVRGLARLTLNNTPAPVPAPPPPVVDDPGKRIASLVPGDPAYVVTADGARYFVGAMLPSGYRLTQVAPRRVTVERDGQESTLNF